MQTTRRKALTTRMKNLMTPIAVCAMITALSIFIMIIGLCAWSPPGYSDEFHGSNRLDRPAFDRLDADKDGKISLKAFKNFSPSGRAPEDMFKFLDKNTDGVLTLNELENAGPPRERRR